MAIYLINWHIAGEANVFADWLSRLSIGLDFHQNHFWSPGQRRRW
jgi:hypothetical protein